MDSLGGSLFVGLVAATGLGAVLSVSDSFADSVRWRSALWTVFWGFVTASMYFPRYLVEHDLLTPSVSMGIPELRAQIAGWVEVNWLTSSAFVLGMVALTLAFSGQQHDELLAVKKVCKYLSPILFALGFLLPVIQFFAHLVG